MTPAAVSAIVFVVCLIITVVRWFQIHRDLNKRGASAHVVCGWYFWGAIISVLYYFQGAVA